MNGYICYVIKEIIMKSVFGPSIEPFGTPEIISSKPQNILFILTHCLFLRYDRCIVEQFCQIHRQINL